MPDDELVSYRDDCRDFLDNTKESQAVYVQASNELFRRLEAGEKAITTMNKVIDIYNSNIEGMDFQIKMESIIYNYIKE